MGGGKVIAAAYEVLRREYPARLPGMPVLERLMELCEESLDFHRAAAIADRALAAGPVSDVLLLRYARVSGVHQGNVVILLPLGAVLFLIWRWVTKTPAGSRWLPNSHLSTRWLIRL